MWRMYKFLHTISVNIIIIIIIALFIYAVQQDTQSDF